MYLCGTHETEPLLIGDGIGRLVLYFTLLKYAFITISYEF